MIVIGHSQGTLFLRNLMSQINTWWDGLRADGQVPDCASTDGQPSLSAPPPPPIAALYIAPAFASTTSNGLGESSADDISHGSQRYVSLAGDILNQRVAGFAVGAVPPTAQPTPQQWNGTVLDGLLTTHTLIGGYLAKDPFGAPTPSRQQVIDRFHELVDYVTSVPGIEGNGCATTTTSESSTTDTTPTTSDASAVTDTTPATDATATTATTDTTPTIDTTPSDTPSTDATPTSDTSPAATGPDQTFSGRFAPPDPSNNPGHVTFLTNTIRITVHADGSADGAYALSYTENDTYLSPDVLPNCVQTFNASGTLKLTADGGGTGSIVNLSEATPTAVGCWPGWSSTLRSQGGWRLNRVEGGHALGGVDIYGQGIAFDLPAG